MRSTVQFLGLCRFSVPSIGGFQSQPGELDDIRARLYAADRLEQRLAWFEHVTLPGLAAQSDPDFTLVLMIGVDLPALYRSRLETLIAAVPQIRLVAVKPGPHRALCAESMRRNVSPEAEVLVQFRFDDDDALPSDFVSRTKRDLPAVLGLLDQHDQFALDYGKGFVLRWRDDGLFVEPRFAKQWTPGLLHVSRPALGRFILDMDHVHMWRYMPMLSLTDDFMWVRGAHSDNDSSVPRPRSALVPLRAEDIDRQLADRFKIDQTAFARRLLDIMPKSA